VSILSFSIVQLEDLREMPIVERVWCRGCEREEVVFFWSLKNDRVWIRSGMK
jgi:hypothetical protein